MNTTIELKMPTYSHKYFINQCTVRPVRHNVYQLINRILYFCYLLHRMLIYEL